MPGLMSLPGRKSKHGRKEAGAGVLFAGFGHFMHLFAEKVLL
jgi:hypothetical protein